LLQDPAHPGKENGFINYHVYCYITEIEQLQPSKVSNMHTLKVHVKDFMHLFHSGNISNISDFMFFKVLSIS